MSDNRPRPNEENAAFEKPGVPAGTATPETATEEVDRAEETLPDNGVAPEYRDEDRRKEMPDVDRVSK